MTLSRYEKVNLAFLIGGGVLLAIFSIAFRFFVDRGMFGIPAGIFSVQYIIAVVVFGLLLILLWRTNSQNANYAYAVLTFAFGLGVLLPPAPMTLEEIGMSIAILPLVIGGGVYHYRFNDASNVLFIGLLTLFLHEFWVFGVTYALLAFLSIGQPMVFIGIILMTVMLVGIRRVLMDELNKTKDNSSFAQGLAVFLDPL
jgi:hypothetical protein